MTIIQVVGSLPITVGLFRGFNVLDESQILDFKNLIENNGRYFISVTFLKYDEQDENKLTVTYSNCYVKILEECLINTPLLLQITTEFGTSETFYLHIICRYTYDNSDISSNFSRMSISDGRRKSRKCKKRSYKNKRKRSKKMKSFQF